MRVNNSRNAAIVIVLRNNNTHFNGPALAPYGATGPHGQKNSLRLFFMRLAAAPWPPPRKKRARGPQNKITPPARADVL